MFPIIRGNAFLAQIDVDSDDTASFDAEDKASLGQVAARLVPLF